MGKGVKIAIALVACISIWLVFAIINAAAGNKHGGGIIVMMIMFGIITFVWKSIVGKKDSDEELITVNLHTGSGDNRVDFEVQLTNDELVKMADIRKQDPEKWQDNDYELVKTIKKDFRIESLENTTSVVTEESNTKTVQLKQDGIEVFMSLETELVAQMDVLRNQNPEKWQDNDVELVREARKILKRTTKETIIEEPQKSVIIEEHERLLQTDMPVDIILEESDKIVPLEHLYNPITEKPFPSSDILFGNKLESENRRGSNPESHLIRQDDIDICINIEDNVYRKMIELQSENPKKWVNKELDLYKHVKSLPKHNNK